MTKQLKEAIAALRKRLALPDREGNLKRIEQMTRRWVPQTHREDKERGPGPS